MKRICLCASNRIDTCEPLTKKFRKNPRKLSGMLYNVYFYGAKWIKKDYYAFPCSLSSSILPVQF